MHNRKRERKNAGLTYAEYAIIVVLVGLVILSMKGWMYETIKSTVKGISDSFLGNKQEEVLKKEEYITKVTRMADVEDKEGGAQNHTVEGYKDINLTTEEEGKPAFFAPDFIGWKEGAVKAP